MRKFVKNRIYFHFRRQTFIKSNSVVVRAMAVVTCPYCHKDFKANDILKCPFCNLDLKDKSEQMATKHVIRCSAYINQRRYSDRKRGRPSNAAKRAYLEGILDEE